MPIAVAVYINNGTRKIGMWSGQRGIMRINCSGKGNLRFPLNPSLNRGALKTTLEIILTTRLT